MKETAKIAIEGKVITLNRSDDILESGVIYIDSGVISDIRSINEDPPSGFETVEIVKTRGSIFPGLIELHNHLAYNVLQMWNEVAQTSWARVPLVIEGGFEAGW